MMSTEPGPNVVGATMNAKQPTEVFPDVAKKTTNGKEVKTLLKKIARNSVMPLSMDTAVKSSLGPPSSAIASKKTQVGPAIIYNMLSQVFNVVILCCWHALFPHKSSPL